MPIEKIREMLSRYHKEQFKLKHDIKKRLLCASYERDIDELWHYDMDYVRGTIHRLQAVQRRYNWYLDQLEKYSRMEA